ncbi:nucleoside 2-deoxyribosyltransferase [Loigolactobacillus binensis]|uniref:Putative 2'-deoxynucleoside 5'-phosphate N-hydrolase 1 n=1 Tax=Loigolactobacillus binensis TaxID=2559922 RepID=A0ABW3E8S0_9LACO|nr:nucleoside 2-deoxyribosyltransferase [Loigolactobacillus binensis]
MKIYFAAAIRGGRDDVGLYQQLIAAMQQQHQVLTEHIGDPKLTAAGQISYSDAMIRQQDIHWLETCDVLVAETTHPSLGVGYELAYAEKIAKPVIILQRNRQAKLSAMISGTPYFTKIFNYQTLAQAIIILQRELAKLAD